MKHISVLIKPASSLCNLRCKYCFYANISSLREVKSYGTMRPKVTKKMIENIYKDLEDGDELSLAFQGGEPTCAGLGYFKYLIKIVNAQEKQVKVNYSIQTNGTLIDSEWCEFLKENNFLVGLSIDGHSEAHNTYRLDDKGNQTFERVLTSKKLFDQYEIEYNILCVLTEQLSNDYDKVFKFLMENKIEYIQFIPCLDDLDAVEKSEFALTPEGFSRFYDGIFDQWIKELRNNHYLSIKLFDDILNLFVTNRMTACGLLGQCSVQYVIEGDGSVFPCDFYALDDYKLGNITENTLKELFEQELVFSFISHCRELPTFCYDCPFKRMCNGGCMRMQDSIYVNEENTYCGYQSVLQKIIPKVEEILYYSYQLTNKNM